jgi:uncharacterized membrane protein YqjE
MSDHATGGRGLFDSLGALAASLVALAHTRLELLTTELEEERARQQSIVLTLGLGVACLTLALLLVVVFVLAVFWDTHRLAALGIMIAVFTGVGAGAALLAWRKIRTKPRLLGATLAELAKDYHHLTRR